MNILIVGGGKVGRHLANLLLANGQTVTIIEANHETMSALGHDLPKQALVYGSGTDPTLLESLDIRHVDVVAAVTGEDETNLVVCSLARYEFHVLRTVARINNPKNAWLFTPDMGVDVAFNQADLMAHLILEEMSLGEMMTLLKLRKGQVSLVAEQLEASSKVIGKTVGELELPRDCVLTAIVRGGQLLLPKGDTRLQIGDEVLALVHEGQSKELAALFDGARGTPSSAHHI
jgi:trk system potassium uptake protein